MNTPNKLTILRILLIPLLVWLIYDGLMTWALGVFVLASLTDWLDGYIARKYNQITTFGKFMDPLADKLLVTAALVAFVDLGYISGIVAIIVISREFIVTGLRLVAISENKVIAAGWWGKIKTTLQIVMIIMIMIYNNDIYQHGTTGTISFHLAVMVAIWGLIWLTTAVTVISGIDYIWKNRSLLKTGGN